VSYKLTRKAEADLAALIDFSLERFGSDTALRHLDKLERSMEALDRGDFEGQSSPLPPVPARSADGRYRRTGSITSASAANCAY
jgi:plasmid stabilization system protein ParE